MVSHPRIKLQTHRPAVGQHAATVSHSALTATPAGGSGQPRRNCMGPVSGGRFTRPVNAAAGALGMPPPPPPPCDAAATSSASSCAAAVSAAAGVAATPSSPAVTSDGRRPFATCGGEFTVSVCVSPVRSQVVTLPSLDAAASRRPSLEVATAHTGARWTLTACTHRIHRGAIVVKDGPASEDSPGELLAS